MKYYILLLLLTSCTIPLVPKPPLPNDILTCNRYEQEYHTNEDLVYNIYNLRKEYDECKLKHDTLIKLYNNIY